MCQWPKYTFPQCFQGMIWQNWLFSSLWKRHGVNTIIPWIHLTRKDLKYNFSNASFNTINNLKGVLMSTPVLTQWVPDVPMTIETDTSNYAIVAIISITLLNHEINPVIVQSHTLTTSELNYDTNDKELLTIEAFWKVKHYLEGSMSPINIVTDHKNFDYFSTTNYWHAAKPGGQNSFLNSISSVISTLGMREKTWCVNYMMVCLLWIYQYISFSPLLFIVSITFLIYFQLLLFKLCYLEAMYIFLHFSHRKRLLSNNRNIGNMFWTH